MSTFIRPVVGQSINELRNQTIHGKTVTKRDAAWELFKKYRTTNKDSALFFAKQSKLLSSSISDSLMLVKSLNALGYLFRENAEYSNSISSYQEALKLAEVQNYKDQIKFLLNNLAIVNTYYGRYDKALDYHFQSLKVREVEGDKQEIAIAFNNIGLVYYKIEDYHKAITFFRQSLDIKEQHLKNTDAESTLSNIGLAQIGLKDYKAALKTYDEIIVRCQQACDEQILLHTYSNKGLAYFRGRNLNDSEVSFRKSLELASQLNDDVYITIAEYYLAKINFDRSQYTKAMQNLDSADIYVALTDAKEWQMRIDALYAEIYYELGEYQEAYKYSEKASATRESMLNEALIRNIANIQLDFQDELSQRIIATKDDIIDRRTSFIWVIGGFSIVITLLLIVLYRNIQLKKKANVQLEEAKSHIEHQNEALINVNAVLEERVKERTIALKKTNEALKKSNEELDNFIYRTSHDIKGPLATLMGVCNVAIIDVKDVTALNYFDKLSETASRLNGILSRLLIINQINNSALQIEIINLEDLIDGLIVENKKIFTGLAVDFEILSPEKLNIKSDKGLLEVIFGNLINNALKFRNNTERKQPFISVTTVLNGENLIFEIIDNGIGINDNEVKSIFNLFSKASEMTGTSGIGLYLVKLAVEKLNGNIKYQKTINGNTKFSVKIPI